MSHVSISPALKRREIALDADYDNLDTWSKAVFAKYPNAKLHQERLNDGYAKVAFVNNQVVAKFTMGGTKSRHDGWVS